MYDKLGRILQIPTCTACQNFALSHTRIQDSMSGIVLRESTPMRARFQSEGWEDLRTTGTVVNHRHHLESKSEKLTTRAVAGRSLAKLPTELYICTYCYLQGSVNDEDPWAAMIAVSN